MVHHSQCLALRLEPGQDVARLHPAPHHLERHPAVHRRGLLGLIDRAHAALPQDLEDAVWADA